jgi:hypothetical protein
MVKRDVTVNDRPGGRVSGLIRARQRLLAHRARPFDVAESPARQSEEARCGGGIHAEPELSVAIALGIVCPRRLDEVGLCADEIALEQAHDPDVAARDRRLCHPPRGFGLAQEALRGLPRQAGLAAQLAAYEQPVIGVESLASILYPAESAQARANAVFDSSEA